MRPLIAPSAWWWRMNYSGQLAGEVASAFSDPRMVSGVNTYNGSIMALSANCRGPVAGNQPCTHEMPRRCAAMRRTVSGIAHHATASGNLKRNLP